MPAGPPNGYRAHTRAVVTRILLAGWTLAGVLYASAPAPVDDQELRDLQQSRRYVGALERIGGKAGVLAEDLNDWIGSLWEGEARAYTVAGLTALVGVAYAVARRAARPELRG